MDILQATYTIFKEDYLRDSSEFIEIIGIENSTNYNSELATLNSKFTDSTFLFTEEAVLLNNRDKFSNIYSTLLGFDSVSEGVTNLHLDITSQCPNITDSLQRLYDSLDNSIYMGKQSKTMCITRCLLWIDTYIPVKSINSQYPKVIYYGDITQETYYALQILYTCNFDILYINPVEDKRLTSIVPINKQVFMTSFSPYSYMDRVKVGEVLDIVITDNSLISKSVSDELYEGTGMFPDWKYRDGYTHTTLLKGIAEDIKSYYKEPPKLRPGFKVEGNVVTVPTLFKVICGVYSDLSEYKSLVDFCKVDNCLFVTDEFITNMSIPQESFTSINECIGDNYSIDVEKLKYRKEYYIDRYSVDVQNLLLRKLRDFPVNNIINSEMGYKDYSALIYLIFRLNPTIISQINSFDFPNNNPKITMFIGYTDSISQGTKLLLAFLNSIGFDILIFNPSGTVTLTDAINPNLIDSDMIGGTRTDISYSDLTKDLTSSTETESKGILGSFFGLFK